MLGHWCDQVINSPDTHYTTTYIASISTDNGDIPGFVFKIDACYLG